MSRLFHKKGEPQDEAEDISSPIEDIPPVDVPPVSDGTLRPLPVNTPDEEDEEEAAEFPENGGVTVEVQPLAENIKDPVCQVLFETLDDTISFCSALGEKAVPSSRLYKHNDRYYLFADFTGAEGEKAAAGFLNLAGEFGGDTAGKGVSEAFLKEHKRCMIPSQAVEKLGTIG